MKIKFEKEFMTMPDIAEAIRKVDPKLKISSADLIAYSIKNKITARVSSNWQIEFDTKAIADFLSKK